MKKMKKGSKGFTLTELAIVIAVIAILIAVLVPTFVSLINKAEESNDVITVRNMNTVLSTETDDIDKPTDALKIVYEEGGYSVANMTPKSTGKIVYDELTSSFVFVYPDGTTYPEDTTTKLTAYTTWELVSTSDIEPDDNGEYHFDTSDYANNSIILKGSDWAGKTVYAKYGVELWNDNDTSTTLSGLYIENTDTEVQNVVAEAGSVSLAKSAIKTAGVLDSTRNIIVNVKTNYLSYAADVYNISDHSTVNVTLTTDGNGTYYQYGTSAGYDFTNKSGNIVVCNETQAENIKSNSVVIIVDTNDKNSTSVYLSDSTETLTTAEIEEVVTLPVDTTQETFEVTVTGDALTITITNTETAEVTESVTIGGEDGYSSVADYKEEATTSGLGTEKYPYLVSTYTDLVEKVKSDCYIQLESSISCSGTITIDTNVTLNLNSYYISYTKSTVILVNSGATLTIKDDSGKGYITTSKAGTGNTSAKMSYAINNQGTLYLESGSITQSVKYAVGIYNNAGIVYMKGGSVGSSYSSTGLTYGMYNTGKLYITGGNIISANSFALWNYGGSAYISGGNLTGKSYAIKNYGYGDSYGEVNISGGSCGSVYCDSYSDTYVTGDAISGLYIYTNTGTTTATILDSLKESVTLTTKYGDNGEPDGDGYDLVKTSATIDVNGASKAATCYSVYMTENSAHAYVEHEGEKTYYTTFKNALTSSVSGDVIVLLKNSKNTNSGTISLSKTLIIDLNGYNLITENSNELFTLSTGVSLTFKNGTITKTTSNAFTVEAGSSLILDDVDLTTGGYGVYVRGEGASVTVTNGSTITAETFAVSTNAGTSDYYNVAITIENSTLYANCGILFNVPGSLTISGSTVTGGVQAVIVRAGTATISNSTLKSELTDNSNWSRYDDENWGDGNGVAYAVLVIGNKNGTYAGDAQVTIDNVIFAYDTTAGSENGVYIYMYGGVVYNTTGSEEPNKAILYYDLASVAEIITKGSNDYIEIIQSAD